MNLGGNTVPTEMMICFLKTKLGRYKKHAMSIEEEGVLKLFRVSSSNAIDDSKV